MRRVEPLTALLGCAALLILSGIDTRSALGAGIRIDRVEVREITDPTYEYTFDLYLEAGSMIQSGDFITIYDIVDLRMGTNNQPRFWAASFSFLGVDPPGSLPFTDSSTLRNVTWDYAAPNPIVVDPLDPDQRVFLGRFSVETFQTALAPQFSFNYGSQTTLPPPGGGKLPDYGTANAIPEPSSLALALLGLAGLGRLVTGTKVRRGAAR